MRWYYSSKLTTGTTFKGNVIDFGFKATNMIIQAARGNTEDIKFAWNDSSESNNDGDIEKGEPLSLQDIDARYVAVKSASGSMTYRIWAWAK